MLMDGGYACGYVDEGEGSVWRGRACECVEGRKGEWVGRSSRKTDGTADRQTRTTGTMELPCEEQISETRPTYYLCKAHSGISWRPGEESIAVQDIGRLCSVSHQDPTAQDFLFDPRFTSPSTIACHAFTLSLLTLLVSVICRRPAHLSIRPTA